MSATTQHQSPSLTLLAMEPLRGTFDYLMGQFMGASPKMGDGHIVVVFPGLGMGEKSTKSLRGYLERCGYLTTDWCGGKNNGPQGDFDQWLSSWVNWVESLSQLSSRKVSLIGWSLGGVYAREVARCLPHAVRQVITLGTPIAAGDGATNIGDLYEAFKGKAPPLAPELEHRLRLPLPVPATSIYSRSDGIVASTSCVESASSSCEALAVETVSHMGLVSHPVVLSMIAERLAQPEGQWKPFRSL